MASARVLVLATTTGYQVRTFGEAAARQQIDLVFATDRCQMLDDPWRDAAIPVRFYDEDTSLAGILKAAASRPIDGVLAVGDRPTVLAARAAAALGLGGHPADAARTASNKQLFRQRVAAAGLPSPAFHAVAITDSGAGLDSSVGFPCVVKPLALSGSRGVIRADDSSALRAAVDRVRRLLSQREVLAMRDAANETILIEEFVAGREFAVEGIMEAGELRVMALFDKPDPLKGPFFEETIYVTPSAATPADQTRIVQAVADVTHAIGLRHGPIHAECRVSRDRVVVLEVAARPIGGLCARALRFVDDRSVACAYEEVLLRHAVGGSVAGYTREASASAVLMVPIPKGGRLTRVRGVERAAAIAGINEVRITAKEGQALVPIPEGASYLGFVFARAGSAQAAVDALRAAHAELQIEVRPELRAVNRDTHPFDGSGT